MNYLIGLIVGILTISATAQWLDVLLSRNRLRKLRLDTSHVWGKIHKNDNENLTRDANRIFCDLFDHLYGDSTFSSRRVWSSFISTSLSLIFFTLVIGYHNTIWPEFFDSIGYAVRVILIGVFSSPESPTTFYEIQYINLLEHFVLFAAIPILLNYIPDYFSLAETRFVLTISRGRGGIGILLLILIDLLATTVIFVLGLFVLMAVVAFMLFDEVLELPSVTAGLILEIMIDPQQGLPFFLTTFVTSILWIMFAFAFIAVRYVGASHPLTRRMLLVAADTNRPVTVVSSILIFFVIVVYLTMFVGDRLVL